jgi:hypothetical protein
MEKSSAGRAHAKMMGDCEILLGLIRDTLIAREAKVKEAGINWGHAGSAQHYRKLLKEALMEIRVSADEDAVMRQIEAEVASRQGGKGY